MEGALETLINLDKNDKEYPLILRCSLETAPVFPKNIELERLMELYDKLDKALWDFYISIATQIPLIDAKTGPSAARGSPLCAYLYQKCHNAKSLERWIHLYFFMRNRIHPTTSSIPLHIARLSILLLCYRLYVESHIKESQEVAKEVIANHFPDWVKICPYPFEKPKEEEEEEKEEKKE